MIIQEIGQEMKRFRKKNGYTQAELAEMLGVTKQSISNYETGKSQPNLSVIIHFSIVSKIPVEEIVFFNKNKHLLKEPACAKIIEEFRTMFEYDNSIQNPLSIHSDEIDKLVKDLYKNMDKSIF